MDTIEFNNKKLMQNILHELSNGNDNLLLDSMAEEMNWIWMGSGSLSKIFKGKDQILGDLWSAVRKTLNPPYKVIANNFIAEGDYVTVEAIGQNSTPDGKLYNNKYCWVCRIQDGKIFELKEYMDTDLVVKTFSWNKSQFVNAKFLVEFEIAKVIFHYHNETSLTFTIIEKHGVLCDETETVAINLTEVGPNIFLVSWQEKSKTTLSQIQDFNTGTIYSNWTTPNGELITRKGTISIIPKE